MNRVIGLLLFVVMMGLLVWFWRRSVRGGKGRTRRSAVAQPSMGAGYAKVRGSTQRRLIRLLNGDQRTAQRLLNQARLRYPNHDENWYWEKVIFDLERDRHLL
jgi:hypothetical protein